MVMTRSSFSNTRFLSLLGCLATMALALTLFSSSASAKPGQSGGLKASAKVSRCVSSALASTRRLEFRGTMQSIKAGGKMEMKFDVYRRYHEQKRFKRMTELGLSEWLANSDVDATKYVHNLPLLGVETSASYKARVAFRWLDSDGKVVAQTKRTTRLCKQKQPLPDIVVRSVSHFPASGANVPAGATRRYVVELYNKGRSSVAEGQYVTLTVGGAAVTPAPLDGTTDADWLPAKSKQQLSFYGPDCSGDVVATFDPLRVVRESNDSNNVLITGC